MNEAAAHPKVLVASDSFSEALNVAGLLEDHFANVRSWTVGADTGSEFWDFAPDVLVLAFRTLRHAQEYYASLGQSDRRLAAQPHRTILLCSTAEVQAAFELCKSRYYDDYVIFWPAPHDGLRLPMSVCNLHRELDAIRFAASQQSESRALADHLSQIERRLRNDIEVGEKQIDAIAKSLDDWEGSVTSTNESALKRIIRAAAMDGASLGALATEMELLTQAHLTQVRSTRDGIEVPLRAWANGLKENVTPAVIERSRRLVQARRRPVVLAVEDDVFAQKLLSHVVRPESHELIIAANASEALRELTRSAPDIILMDFRLPEVDGVTLTRHIKADPEFAHIPVIMMTGDSTRETVVNSIEAGAADFLVKPFSLASIQAKLAKVLAS